MSSWSCSSSRASFGPWGVGRHRSGPFPRRSLEILAIVAAFFAAWPVGVAYVVWKLAGYPYLGHLQSLAGRVRGGEPAFAFSGFPGAHRGTGNLAFDDYRRGEIERLERERRQLDDERREFGAFVEEVKRAKDREEFDAFMRKRGGTTGTGPVVDA